MPTYNTGYIILIATSICWFPLLYMFIVYTCISLLHMFRLCVINLINGFLVAQATREAPVAIEISLKEIGMPFTIVVHS
jgi:hypothetical protein